jgi:hypothetical protein
MEIVAQGKLFPTVKEFFQIVVTFSLTVFAWIFFRAENMSQALSYLSGIFSKSLFSLPNWTFVNDARGTIIMVILFVLIEWLGREQQYAIANLELKYNKPLRWSFYVGIVFLLFMCMKTEETPFIYFQF